MFIFLLNSCVLKDRADPSASEVSPASGFTQTEVPTSPVNLATSTSTDLPAVMPTQILQPTYTPQEAKSYFEEQLKSVDSCQLPCILGFTPGRTAFNDVKETVARLGNVSQPQLIEIYSSITTSSASGDAPGEMLDVSLVNGNAFLSNNILITALDETVEQIYLSASVYHDNEGQGGEIYFGEPYFQNLYINYSLSEILRDYGIPPVVLVGPEIYDGFTRFGDFDLVLIYPEKFFIEYIFPMTQKDGNFIGCPSQYGFISIVTWSRGNKISNNGKMPFYGSRLSLDDFKPIKDATSLTAEEFFQKFKIAGKDCLQTPVRIWQP
jgi:hypothetical protein